MNVRRLVTNGVVPGLVASTVVTALFAWFAVSSKQERAKRIRPPARMASFVPNRVELVDSRTTDSGTNHLLRGAAPLHVSGKFSYEAIAEAARERFQIELSRYRLVIISMLDNAPSSSRKELQIEFDAFGIGQAEFDALFPEAAWPPYKRGLDMRKLYGTQVGGHPGSLVWYPLQPCGVFPSNCELQFLDEFGFPGLVDFLNELLDSKEPTVVYIHCSNGSDRVGTAIAGYQLKYLRKPENQVLTQEAPDGALLKRGKWSPGFAEGVQWYASYLKKAPNAENPQRD